jgi:hypothetical protein
MSKAITRGSSMSYVSSASMESMLEKHGNIMGPLMVKKCWCVLRDGKLSYYKDMHRVREDLRCSQDYTNNKSVSLTSICCFELVLKLIECVDNGVTIECVDHCLIIVLNLI